LSDLSRFLVFDCLELTIQPLGICIMHSNIVFFGIMSPSFSSFHEPILSLFADI